MLKRILLSGFLCLCMIAGICSISEGAELGWYDGYRDCVLERHYPTENETSVNLDRLPDRIALHDLDGNGTPELLVLIPGFPYDVVYVLTWKNSAVLKLGEIMVKSGSLVKITGSDTNGLFAVYNDSGYRIGCYFDVRNGQFYDDTSAMLYPAWENDNYDTLEFPKDSAIQPFYQYFTSRDKSGIIDLSFIDVDEITEDTWDQFVSGYGFSATELIDKESSEKDWRTLYQKKIQDIEKEYQDGIRTLAINTGYVTLPFFSLQDIDFDGIPELYHTQLLMVGEGECKTDQEYEELYYIQDGIVLQGSIQSSYHLGLIPGYREGDPGDYTYERWQFITFGEQENSVCFMTNDSCSYGAADCPERTIQSLIFDKDKGVLKARVVLHQDANSYEIPKELSGYQFIGVGSTFSWTRYEPDGNLWDWQAPDLNGYPVVPVSGSIFSDVPSDSWFADYVAYVFEKGLMIGMSDNVFNPQGSVTVAQAITMAARIHSLYHTGKDDFDQRSGADWYQVYVDYAKKNNIIDDVYASLDMNAKATRSQYVEIFAKALPDKGLKSINNIPDGSIPDVNMRDSYAADVYKLYKAGVLTGNDEKGTFSPLSSITRAESAAIVTRMSDVNSRRKITLTV